MFARVEDALDSVESAVSDLRHELENQSGVEDENEELQEKVEELEREVAKWGGCTVVGCIGERNTHPRPATTTKRIKAELAPGEVHEFDAPVCALHGSW